MALEVVISDEGEDFFVAALRMDVSDYEECGFPFVVVDYVFGGAEEIELAFEAVDSADDADEEAGCVGVLFFQGALSGGGGVEGVDVD